MKHQITLIAGLIISIGLWAQPVKKPAPAPVKNIMITLAPLKNCKVYLGSYYGKGKILSDSAMLNDKSTGVFKGNTKLPGGIYFVVSPQYTIQFELLVGSNQQFSIVGDTAQKDNPIIKGSADNDLFKEYTKATIEKGKALSDLNQRFTAAKTKEDDYLKYYISPEPDSIIKEVKYILLSARTGKEMYPYLLTKFTNKYLNPEYMGQDKVFLYLFDNFYSKGDTSFLNPASRKTIFERAYSMMANQLGNPAPLLNLRDTTEKVIPMYGINSPITLIVFWDPTCGHCKEEIPRIDSMYKAKWKALGVSLYAVNIAEKTMGELKKFVTEKHLSSDWIHVYQSKEEREAEQATGQPNFRQLYDVLKTPTLYLLDEKKNIIAKQLSIEQFDDLIMTKLKNQHLSK